MVSFFLGIYLYFPVQNLFTVLETVLRPPESIVNDIIESVTLHSLSV